MAPKHDSKADEATVSVNVDELRNSKDQVLMRLMAIQSYIADLSKSYLEHANNVINGESATIDIPPLPVLPNGLDLAPRSPGARSEAGEKKRKRRAHDPNAPKRPLTPYFLYMQNNRQKISQDLGSDVKPKDVSEEGTRRWQDMPAAQKEVWRQMYLANYEKYKGVVADYKAGKAAGDDDHDPAASQLQNDIDAENQEDSDDESSHDDSEDESSPSPAPAPKEKTPPPSGKRRRSTGKNAKAETSPVKQSSPQKKGKKNEPAPAPTAAPESTGKRKSKKRKSEA
ncbi:hypothetical protein N7492_001005 [Penicillium capsulatum]|uniref:HMG box domain-containing protein n=1 Tax=Penicillium capsulatum TaxID=69766 RepID=A0A9W9IQM9_9EURO|nr:hypothetical protein N7492_001005 [Penicillium capsulatum]KAJ6129935.1 hypothetical protein N7512_002715 [Penicillium capsulatum]